MPVVSEFEGIGICWSRGISRNRKFLCTAIPANKLKLVLAWSELHKQELNHQDKIQNRLFPFQ